MECRTTGRQHDAAIQRGGWIAEHRQNLLALQHRSRELNRGMHRAGGAAQQAITRGLTEIHHDIGSHVQPAQ
jgi:hypothetical protein